MVFLATRRGISALQPGIEREREPLALEGGVLTTEPPGRSPACPTYHAVFDFLFTRPLLSIDRRLPARGWGGIQAFSFGIFVKAVTYQRIPAPQGSGDI